MKLNEVDTKAGLEKAFALAKKTQADRPVELDPKVEASLDLRVRQVNDIINSVGEDREKLAIEVINAIASTQNIRGIG
jgi:hypothetical protein